MTWPLIKRMWREAKIATHTHDWAEECDGFKRVCKICGCRQSMMQSRLASFDEPALSWMTVQEPWA